MEQMKRAALGGARGEKAGRESRWMGRLFENPSDPSMVLLHTLGGGFLRAIEGFNELPVRMRTAYYEEKLGLTPRPPQPDRVFAQLTKVEAHRAIRLSKGTSFTAKEGDAVASGDGDEDRVPQGGAPALRHYDLGHGATVTGMSIGAMTGYLSLVDGRDALAHLDVGDGQLQKPCFPFNRTEDVVELGVSRDFYLADPRLSAARAGTEIQLTFSNVGPNTESFQQGLATIQWSVTTGEGFQPIDAGGVHVVDDDVLVTLRVETTIRALDQDVDRSTLGRGDQVAAGLIPAIRLHKLPSSSSAANRDLRATTSMAFESMSIVFEARQSVSISDAFTNDSRVAVDAPFAPFDDPAQVGSSFFLACGAVFALPLSELSISFLAASGGLPLQRIVGLTGGAEGDEPAGLRPVVSMRRWRDGEWQAPVGHAWVRPLPGPVRTGGDLEAFGGEISVVFRDMGLPFTEITSVGGVAGYWLRFKLERGDLGWARFLKQQEDFVREAVERAQPSLIKRMLSAVGNTGAAPSVPPSRPMAPMLDGARICFRSETITLDPGWYWRRIGDTSPQGQGDLDELYVTGADGVRRFAPFHNRRDGWGGELYVGLREVPRGESAALFLDVATVRAFGGRSNGRVEYSYFGAGRWQQLETRDGTRGLTQSGILNWRAPADWESVTQREPFTIGVHEEMHWIRIRVETPGEALWLTRAVCDVAELVRRDGAGIVGPALRQGAQLIPEEATAGLVGAVLVEPTRGGAPEESSDEFLDRAGRQTRHRGRAVSAREVEGMVLDEFPTVQLVHCWRDRRPRSRLRGPNVLLVPAAVERLPVASADLIKRVHEFLRSRMGPGLLLSVASADFAPLQVHVRVHIDEASQPVRVSEKIQDALTGRMIPAHRGRGHGRTFRRSIGILELEECVANVRGVAAVEGLEFTGAFAGQHVAAAPPGAIITSASRHMITTLAPEGTAR